MKILFIGLLAFASISAFAAEFSCIATLTENGRTKSVRLAEFREAYDANIDGFAFGAQVDQFEDVGAFKILILDQKNGRVAGKYIGPAPVTGGISASLSASSLGVGTTVTCKRI